MDQRPYVLGSVFAVTALLAVVILFDVLGTIFLALSVAFLLSPLRRRLRRQGFSRLVSTVLVTVVVIVGVVVLFSPVAYLLFLRFNDIVTLATQLPESILLEFAGFSYELVIADVLTAGVTELQEIALNTLASLPVILLKLALFVLLVFSILYNEQNIRIGVFSVVPPAYRDISEAMHKRARETLYALYVLQAATGLATFLLALPVFFLLSYSSPIVLAAVAGLLQFVPVLGPSVLIVVLVGAEILAGDIVGAVLVAAIGGALIVAVPDVVIRPRLASRHAELDSALYFIGFVGGVLSLGAIGIIVGPLVVALLVESAKLLSTEYGSIEPATAAEMAADPPDRPPAESTADQPDNPEAELSDNPTEPSDDEN